MNILVLIAAGLTLLMFVLLFRKKHNRGVRQMLDQNRDVQPLFKERSARLKYQELNHLFAGNPEALKTLENLYNYHLDGVLNADAYHRRLDELQREYSGA